MSTREYAKNLFSAWSDEDFCDQPRFDKLFFTVLNGQRGVNAAGIQAINFTRWRKAMRDGEQLASIDELKASLLRMERRGYVFTDEDTGEVLIRSRIRNDGLDKHPTMFLAALRILAVIDSPKFAAVMATELDRMVSPDVKGDTDYAKNLRAAINKASVDARTHLKHLADGMPEQLPEPFEGESLRDSPGPSTRPSRGDSQRPGEMGPSEGDSPGPSRGDPVSVSVSGSLTSLSNHLGEEPTQTDTDPEPPQYCHRHPTGHERPCDPCRIARERHTAWETRQAARTAQARADFWTQVENCDDCGPKGLIEDDTGNRTYRCPNHDWTRHA